MSTKSPIKAKPSATNFSSGKFLMFRLADESYGIEVLFIREIVRMQAITPVPEMPPHFKGVTNLRGKVTPVVDLRIKFGLHVDDTTERTCVIVVDVDDMEGVSNLLGLMVDSVEEVINITESDVEASSSSGTAESSESHLGTAKTKSGVINLLDVEKLVNREISGEFATLWAHQ